jgi:nitrilase
MPLRKDDIPDRYGLKERFYQQAGEWINVGDSAIVNPEGEFIAGPLREQEGILCAEIDPVGARGPKWMLDVAGHYARPDVFELIVHEQARPMLAFAQDGLGSIPKPIGHKLELP